MLCSTDVASSRSTYINLLRMNQRGIGIGPEINDMKAKYKITVMKIW